MSRALLARLAMLAVLVLGAVWIARSTEWAEQQVPVPPRGEAARNRFFAAGELALQLGARAEHRETLAALPPPGARLVLASSHWDVFPERDAQLRRWVQAGGHLVVSAAQASTAPLSDWLPVDVVDAPGSTLPPMPRRPGAPPQPPCRMLVGAGDTDAPGARLCTPGPASTLRARAGNAAWSLQGPHGAEFLRVPMGRGSVTVHGPPALLTNAEVLDGDHPHIVAAALQIERGAPVWFVREEAREPLLAWIWRSGWVVVLLAAAAALAWVWRAGVRFGPLAAAPAGHRRSMTEQVAGTGEFLRHHAGDALHAAQARALHEAALARVPGHRDLRQPACVLAIARATALPESDLQRALRPGPRSAHALPADLEVLESARRRLLRGSPVRPT
ncbi:MAG TPA: DUF4350 domain-containing protein [Ramlibacter sp.]